MADQPMDGGPQAGGYLAEQDFSAGTMVNLAGAAVSLALLVGVGVWGYQLVARDVSGVPVVRAAEGDMRTSPKDPGGLPAAHQGLSVNEVAVEGLASEPVDQLTLAPPPIVLDSEDAPMATTIGPDGDTMTSAVPQGGEKPEGMTDKQFASIQALADQLAAGLDPLEDDGETPAEIKPIPVVAVQPEQEEPREQVAETRPVRVEGGLGRSLRPRARPANLGSSASQDTVARAATGPSATPGAREIDPSMIPAGTRLVQLGAYASREIAQTEWDRLGDKFTDYLDGKSRVVQKATSGGRVFYRLRAMGFADLSDARRFCSALMAEGADCIPVVTR